MKLFVLAFLAVTFCTAADLNSVQESDDLNSIFSDPLDSSYYGLTEKDQDSDEDNDVTENNEPLGDIGEDIEEVLDNLNDKDNEIVEETIVVEEEDEDDEEEQNELDNEENNMAGKKSKWNKRRKHKVLKKHGRKMTRKVARFMKQKNITDMSEVPKRKFKGPFRRMHKLASKKDGNENDGFTGKGLKKKIYRKITKRVHKKMNHDNGVAKKLHGICARITKRTEPRKGVMKKLPHNVKNEFLSIFQKRRQELLKCCQKNEDQKSCFDDVHRNKIENMCSLVELTKQADASNPIIKHWQKKAHCCEDKDAATKELCFKNTAKAMRKEKRQKKLSPENRLAHTCKKVQKPIKEPFYKRWFSQMEEKEVQPLKEVFEERWKQMRMCCEKGNIEEKLSCATKLRKERFDRVCAGDEDLKPKTKAKHDTLVKTCCKKQGDDRFSCFMDRRFLKEKITDTESAEFKDDEEVETIVEIDIEEEVDNDEDTRNNNIDEDNEYIYDYDKDDNDYDTMPLMDRMMGDAPAIEGQANSSEDIDAPEQGRHQHRRNKRMQVRQVRRECCQAGTQAISGGESEAERTQECQFKAQTFVEGRETYKDFCRNIFQRCCSRNGDGENSRSAIRQERKETRKANRQANRKTGRRRNRQERRQQRREDKQT